MRKLTKIAILVTLGLGGVAHSNDDHGSQYPSGEGSPVRPLVEAPSRSPEPVALVPEAELNETLDALLGQILYNFNSGVFPLSPVGELRELPPVPLAQSSVDRSLASEPSK